MIQRLIVVAAVLSISASAQIITTNLVAQYAMTDATGTTLPDSSGNGNNGTLVNGPTIDTLGISFNGSTQYISLPTGLITTVNTIQIFTDGDRYLNNTHRAAILGNSSATGLKIWLGSSPDGVTTTGLNKFIDVDMATTLTTSGGINSSATSFTVASTERLTTSNYFSIDSENIICATITPPHNVSGCSRGQAGSSAASHSQGAGVFGRAVGNASTTDLLSYFNLISPSMYTFVADGTSSRALDNGTETLYGGFYSSSSLPFTMSNNVGQWQLGGDTGEFFEGHIYYVLLYSDEKTNTQIRQNNTAIQAIMTARSVPARTDGSHNQSILNCEGTSIDNYGSPGWCAGMSLTFSPSVLVMSQPGISYNGGIDSYTVARDGPLTNPTASRNVITLGAPTNDFVSNNLATTQTAYENAITSVKSEGWQQVYCGYMLSRCTAPTPGCASAVGFASFDAAKDAWNTWLAANYQSIGCTAVIPWDSRFTADGAYANPNPTACGGTTCFSSDGIHPDQAGFAAMSLLAAPIINAATSAGGVSSQRTSTSRTAVRR